MSSKTFDPALIWNGWTTNMIYEGGQPCYIIHAFLEVKTKRREPWRSLCGVRIMCSGLLNLKDREFEPGCIKCRRVLRKAGLLPSGE